MTTSATGVELDPIDGRPIFADGMSRRRYLESTKQERKARFVKALLAPDPDEIQPDPDPADDAEYEK